MKRSIFILPFFLLTLCLYGQSKGTPTPVKNLIVMIPDGTSWGTVTASRWYQIYNKLGGDRLNIDPYICGSVVTYCSNAPIGDSAPTTSCYMTGIPARAGNVSTYPLADSGNDLYPLDSLMAYQPLVTILEAAKMTQSKATGLVFTCEFPHATPADCSSHYYDRGNYKYIASQMAYNNLDVVFGGGSSIITDDIKEHFERNGTVLIQKDLNAFRNYNGNAKVWALMDDNAFPYDLDRDTTQIPSLEEMTRKAINLLSKNENGFFLMVEGSEVDFAAHANDAVGCMTEFLAFDRAVGVALDFARKNGETAVIIMPDHGTGGFNIGNRLCKSYAETSLDQIYGLISTFKNTGKGIAQHLMKTPVNEIPQVFKERTGIELTDAELQSIIKTQSMVEGDYMKVSNTDNVISATNKIINSHICFGFTTGGHTGEEVFLAAYHPDGTIPLGMNRNVEIHQYLCDVMELQTPMPELTQRTFAKHTDVFKGLSYEIEDKDNFPVLVVRKGKKVLKVPAFKSIAYLDGKLINLGSVTVYVDKNETFYLPANILRGIF